MNIPETNSRIDPDAVMPECWRCGNRAWHYTKSKKFDQMYSAKCGACGVPEGLIPVLIGEPTKEDLHRAHRAFLRTFDYGLKP